MSIKNGDKNANVNNIAKIKTFNRRGTIAGFNEEDGHIGPSLRDQRKTNPQLPAVFA